MIEISVRNDLRCLCIIMYGFRRYFSRGTHAYTTMSELYIAEIYTQILQISDSVCDKFNFEKQMIILDNIYL